MYVCVSTFEKFFSSKPIEAKFHVEPPWDGRTKVCSKDPGHMTKMAAITIHSKGLKNFLLRNRKAYGLETLYVASGARVLPNLLN